MPRLLAGRTVEEKLKLNHVIEGECWRWTGAHMRKGYGQLWAAGKTMSVHRLAYELWVGPLSPDLDIDHLCCVRDCINPAHLDAVTHRTNLQRRGERRTHCPQGHALVPENIKWTKSRGNRARTCRRCFNDKRRRRRAELREGSRNAA